MSRKIRSEEDRRITTRLFILLPITFCAFVGGLIVWANICATDGEMKFTINW